MSSILTLCDDVDHDRWHFPDIKRIRRDIPRIPFRMNFHCKLLPSLGLLPPTESIGVDEFGSVSSPNHVKNVVFELNGIRLSTQIFFKKHAKVDKLRLFLSNKSSVALSNVTYLRSGTWLIRSTCTRSSPLEHVIIWILGLCTGRSVARKASARRTGNRGVCVELFTVHTSAAKF